MASTKRHRESKGAKAGNTGSQPPVTATSALSTKLEEMFPTDWRLQGKFQVPAQPATTGGGLRPAMAG